MGKYFGTDGFRGEAGITLPPTMLTGWDVFWAGTTMRCVNAIVTPIQLESSSARTLAAQAICSSTAWLLA